MSQDAPKKEKETPEDIQKRKIKELKSVMRKIMTQVHPDVSELPKEESNQLSRDVTNLFNMLSGISTSMPRAGGKILFMAIRDGKIVSQEYEYKDFPRFVNDFYRYAIHESQQKPKEDPQPQPRPNTQQRPGRYSWYDAAFRSSGSAQPNEGFRHYAHGTHGTQRTQENTRGAQQDTRDSEKSGGPTGPEAASAQSAEKKKSRWERMEALGVFSYNLDLRGISDEESEQLLESIATVFEHLGVYSFKIPRELVISINEGSDFRWDYARILIPRKLIQNITAVKQEEALSELFLKAAEDACSIEKRVMTEKENHERLGKAYDEYLMTNALRAAKELQDKGIRVIDIGAFWVHEAVMFNYAVKPDLAHAIKEIVKVPVVVRFENATDGPRQKEFDFSVENGYVIFTQRGTTRGYPRLQHEQFAAFMVRKLKDFAQASGKRV